MSHRTPILLAALFLAAGAASTAQAQANSSATPGTQSSAPAAQTSSATLAPAQASAKKVWTNDDVGDLRENSVVSAGGASRGGSGKPGDRPSATSKTKDAKSYHDQIAKLQAQLPPIDSQIAQLQAAIDGKFTGDAKTSTRPTGVKGGDWRLELDQLQKKRDGIAAQIDALIDQARRNGVPPNQLP
jgi:hypothetical protein